EFDDPLCLAERIGPDHMRPLWKKLERFQKCGDFMRSLRMAENRQCKSCFGYEDITGDRLKRRAGRIGCALVIAGSDNADSVLLHRDLSRAEYMASAMKTAPDTIDHQGFAEVYRL